MRDSRWPRGMCTARGMWPSSHSSCSRTSTTTGSPESISRRAGSASSSEISARTCCSNSLYVGIAFRNIATTTWPRRRSRRRQRGWAGCARHPFNPNRGSQTSSSSVRSGYGRRRMTPRLRVWLVVGVAAVAAAAIAVGITLATRSDVHRETSKPPPFVPDPTARAKVSRDVRQALQAWPAGTVRRLRILAARYPHSAFVRLELGLALAFGGSATDASRAWHESRRVQPDSPSAVHAADLLNPNTPPGLPPFVPSFTRARTAAERRLLRGAVFQQALRPVSAEREFEAAARAAPNDPEALTAAALGRYDKDNPAAAFSRLGPLVRRFPHAQTVRFHLGLLLIYIGAFDQARREFRLAVAEEPKSTFARESRSLLKRL